MAGLEADVIVETAGAGAAAVPGLIVPGLVVLGLVVLGSVSSIAAGWSPVSGGT